jgi:hypothetical protein
MMLSYLKTCGQTAKSETFFVMVFSFLEKPPVPFGIVKLMLSDVCASW